MSPSLDLHADTVEPEGLQVYFDIDSAGGVASSLAVAKEGLKWKAGRSAVSNLQSSLHLNPIPVQWFDSRRHSALRPLHQVPHLPFGRLVGFPEVEVYLIFPRLYHPSRDHWVITVDEYTQWTDSILLPAIQQTYPASTVQHLPSSADHIRMNGTAAQVEGRSGAQTITPTFTQDFHFNLHADRLDALWECVQTYTQQDGLTHFSNCSILLTAKNLKLVSQRATWAQARDAFLHQWKRAINPTFLRDDFYDIAKEVVPRSPQAMTLCWRRCCLESFSTWLGQSNAAAEDCQNSPPTSRTEGQVTNNEQDYPRTRSRIVGRPLSPSEDSLYDESVHEDGVYEDSVYEDSVHEDSVHEDSLYEDSLNGDSLHEESLHEETPGSDSYNPHQSEQDQNPAPEPSKAQWRQQFYPQSLVRDQCSMTLAPNRTSPLWRRGLRYCQLYNTSKEMFAAGNHYLFGNPHFDSLTLDPAMLRSWQHVGGAVSHSPITLLRGYIHTKIRSHTALRDCSQRSYGTREEYRVTGAVFQTVDRLLCASGVADTPIILPTEPFPFWAYPTQLMTTWWRWNINRLCVGFEMTFSLRPRTFVHWEHTRVMMMFLKCLLYVYGGQGGHPQQSLGLWIDRRTQPRPGSDTEFIQEGMALGPSLAKYGYGWLASKVDWTVMVFKPAHRAYIVFNTPSIQSVYHQRYWAVRQSKDDFLIFHDVLQRVQDYHLDSDRSALLLQLLVDLCLRAFRQDVFRALSERQTQQPLNAHWIEKARAGEVALDIHGFRQVFDIGIIENDLHFVNTKNSAIRHLETLFIRLWGWDGDGNNGDWERKHWEYKPYRVLFRQSYGIIAQFHGMQQARAWRQRLKETWIRSHWILPYPNSSTFWSRGTKQGRLQVWSSVHPGLGEYYERRPQGPPSRITPEKLHYLPISGWKCQHPGRIAPLVQIILPPIPSDLDHFLDLGDSVSNTSEGNHLHNPSQLSIPLPAPGIHPDSVLSPFIHTISPELHFLRRFKKESKLTTDEIHQDSRWQQRILLKHIEAIIRVHQHELNMLQKPLVVWPSRPRPRLTNGLSQIHVTPQQLEDEDSDTGNFYQCRERLRHEILRLHQRAGRTRHEIARIDRTERIIQAHQPRDLTDHDEASQGPSDQLRWAKKRRRLAQDRLELISRKCTR